MWSGILREPVTSFLGLYFYFTVYILSLSVYEYQLSPLEDKFMYTCTSVYMYGCIYVSYYTNNTRLRNVCLKSKCKNMLIITYRNLFNEL